MIGEKETLFYSVFRIKVFLIFQQKRIGKKKKTSVKSCNLNPYWNESFVFIIDEMDMKRVTLEMTVSLYFKNRSKDIILNLIILKV